MRHRLETAPKSHRASAFQETAARSAAGDPSWTHLNPDDIEETPVSGTISFHNLQGMGLLLFSQQNFLAPESQDDLGWPRVQPGLW